MDDLTVEGIVDLVEQQWGHRISIETVRLWLRSGRLRGRILNRRIGWRAERSEVLRFLAGRRSGADEG